MYVFHFICINFFAVFVWNMYMYVRNQLSSLRKILTEKTLGNPPKSHLCHLLWVEPAPYRIFGPIEVNMSEIGAHTQQADDILSLWL